MCKCLCCCFSGLLKVQLQTTLVPGSLVSAFSLLSQPPVNRIHWLCCCLPVNGKVPAGSKNVYAKSNSSSCLCLPAQSGGFGTFYAMTNSPYISPVGNEIMHLLFRVLGCLLLHSISQANHYLLCCHGWSATMQLPQAVVLNFV